MTFRKRVYDLNFAFRFIKFYYFTKYSTYSVKSSILTPYVLFNHYFKYMSDHLYKEKNNLFSKRKINYNLNIHSHNEKLLKSFDSNIVNKYTLAASSHPLSLYKFIDSSFTFRDRSYYDRIDHNQGFLKQCKIYYSMILYYQRMYVYYSENFVSCEKYFSISKKQYYIHKKFLKSLIAAYYSDMSFESRQTLLSLIKFYYIKFDSWNKLYRD